MSVILDIIQEAKNTEGMRNMMYHESVAKIGNKYHKIVKMLSPYEHKPEVSQILSVCREKEAQTRGWIRLGNKPSTFDYSLLKRLGNEVNVDYSIAKQVLAQAENPSTAPLRSKESVVNEALDGNDEKAKEILEAGAPKKRGRKKTAQAEKKSED